MNKLFSIFAVFLIKNAFADDCKNYCTGDIRLALKKSEIWVKCNKKANEISGTYCIYTVNNECFTFESWDNHGS